MHSSLKLNVWKRNEKQEHKLLADNENIPIKWNKDSIHDSNKWIKQLRILKINIRSLKNNKWFNRIKKPLSVRAMYDRNDKITYSYSHIHAFFHLLAIAKQRSDFDW